MTLVKWTPKPLSLFNEMDSMVNSLFGNDWNFPVDHEDWSDTRRFLVRTETSNLALGDLLLKVPVQDGHTPITCRPVPVAPVHRVKPSNHADPVEAAQVDLYPARAIVAQ